jgi:2-polyprenyl-6-methoxyphenol hydroxylase-like FAD-dependent oxidoreductase
MIAGGGPIGLVLGIVLSDFGVPCFVAERNETTTRHPKMDVTNCRSMEIFRRLGIAERLRAVGVPVENNMDVSWVTNMSGHASAIRAWSRSGRSSARSTTALSRWNRICGFRRSWSSQRSATS